jgi:hypothetical protein
MPELEDLGWMAAGAAVLLVVILVVLALHRPLDVSGELAAKAMRVDTVEQMRIALASSGEAEKSAVLAVTDEDSRTFADQARSATSEVERGLEALTSSLNRSRSSEERAQLDRFAQAFSELKRVDVQVLDLAVQNTNLKAYALAFGPAAAALDEMEAALSKLTAGAVGSLAAKNEALLACEARAAARSIQATLAPHIAERSDAAMDSLEARMQRDDQQVRNNLDRLSALQRSTGSQNLDTATASYARFSDLRSQILRLSRENTNVRSLILSLSERQRLSQECQKILQGLQREIFAEPIPGVEYRAPSISN